MRGTPSANRNATEGVPYSGAPEMLASPFSIHTSGSDRLPTFASSSASIESSSWINSEP